MTLQIRRGTDSDRLTITPSVGEPLYTTDTKKLYIGDGSTAGGNIVSGSDTDSASVSAIILSDVDSAYVQARQTTYDFLDSSETIALIDSSYVQARQDLAYSSLTGAPTTVSSFTNDANYLDSTSVQGVINASYIQSNQTTYDFLDSSEAIALIDSAYVQARQSASTDSAAVIALIDSAYVQARQTTDLSSSTTSDLTEGTNLYYTTARADSDFDIRFATKTTDNLTEGSTNLYYTTAKADSDAKNAISVTDAGGDGSLSYSESTGVLTYTGPSATEVRAHLVAGTGVTYDSAAGSISIGQAVGTSDSVVFSALSTTGTVIVGGDLQVNGTTVTVNATDLNVTDNMIYLNDGESSGSPTASIDIGFAANVNDQGSYEHVGFFRDATDQTFKVFQGYTPEPDSSVQINTGHASFALAPFEASTLSGVYLGFDSDFSAKASTTNVSSFINDANYLDSSTATSLVDSAYVQARQTTYDFLDSSETIALIDSAYVQARQTTYDFLDSAETIALIDSAYVQARQTTGTDSAATISLIQANSVDSAEVISLIDSAYVQARQTTGSTTTVSDNAPSSPSAGDLWFNSTNATMYVYYNDGSSSQWVSVSGYASSSAGASSYVDISSNTAATVNNKYIVDTSSAITITLPASPSFGDEIGVIDGTSNAGTNNITINRNNNKILGADSDFIIDVNRTAVNLVYYNAAQGWIISGTN